MNIQYVKDAIYVDKEHTTIDCIVKFAELEQEVPFHACRDDVEAHGRQLFDDLINGKYGAIADWPEPYVDPDLQGGPKIVA